MLKEVRLSDHASYKNIQVLGPLAPVNFVFGGNGSGKTTITRVLARAQNPPPGCSVEWDVQGQLQVCTDNKDYVDENFSPDKSIPGVFMLGKENVEIKQKDELAENKIRAIEDKILRLKKDLDGEDNKTGRIRVKEHEYDSLLDYCWKEIKTRYDPIFREVFAGHRRTKQEFFLECSRQFEGRGRHEIQPRSQEELVERSAVLFDRTYQLQELLPVVDFSCLLKIEQSAIFSKSIVGRSNVDVAALIEKLKNSDWVRKGLELMEQSEHRCPFCQRPMDVDMEKSLVEYFDETFAAGVREVESTVDEYERESRRLLDVLRQCMQQQPDLKKNETFVSAGHRLKQLCESNIKKGHEKKTNPGVVVQFDSALELADVFGAVLSEKNAGITKNNELVRNRGKEIEKLRIDVWDLIYKENRVAFEAKKTAYDAACKAVNGLRLAIERQNKDIEALLKERRGYAEQLANVENAADEINNELRSIGFTSFLLRPRRNSCYEIIRPDGTPASATISEGERTLVTLLYFFKELFGCEHKEDIPPPRIAVIDDPVSSLDAEVLFVVSAFIKGLIGKVESAEGCLKQLIVLTHNIYFQKEVTFVSKRHAIVSGMRTYWLVRKTRCGAKIEKRSENPVKTSYQMMWSEYVKTDHSTLTLQNIMRRILEYYFRILGRKDFDGLCSEFDGVKRLICQSMVSWINDGSHYPGDDLYYDIVDATEELYREVFHEIFRKTNNESHYAMMMAASGVV